MSHQEAIESKPLLYDPLRPLPAHGLSVDVEDYFHVEAFSDRLTPEMWPSFPGRVVENTHRLLELFAKFGARSTFFVLGWVAEREPKLVRDIADAGHEVGCHSYLHRCIYRLTPEQFREDTHRAIAAIEDATGKKLAGYRAPTFSICRKSLWAVEILAQQGFHYDSSVFPIHHDLYGMPRAPRFPFRWDCGRGHSIFEIPLMTARILGINFPAGGGGYLRILPMSYTNWALRRAEQEERPGVVYLHPWEIDPGQPRIRGRLKSRLRHYSNLKHMEGRLCNLLEKWKFTTLGDYLQKTIERSPLPTRSLTQYGVE